MMPEKAIIIVRNNDDATEAQWHHGLESLTFIVIDGGGEIPQDSNSLSNNIA